MLKASDFAMRDWRLYLHHGVTVVKGKALEVTVDDGDIYGRGVRTGVRLKASDVLIPDALPSHMIATRFGVMWLAPCGARVMCKLPSKRNMMGLSYTVGSDRPTRTYSPRGTSVPMSALRAYALALTGVEYDEFDHTNIRPQILSPAVAVLPQDGDFEEEGERWDVFARGALIRSITPDHVPMMVEAYS